MSLLFPSFAAFLVAVLVFPSYISFLRRKRIGQYIREEGPKAHSVKAQTPTMGGLVIMLAVIAGVIAAFFFVDFEKLPAIKALLISLAIGLIGLFDDWSKVVGRSNKGISAKTRLLVEFGLGFALSGALVYNNPQANQLFLWAGKTLTLPPEIMNLYLLFLVPFLVPATANAVNLHDGMDGLAGGTSMLVFATMALLYFWCGNIPMAIVAAAFAGSLAGYLIFNRHPAKIFMGDTGSLYIGGAMAVISVLGGLTLWFIPLAAIYIIETLSVIVQVTYFKLTKNFEPQKPMSSLAIVIHKLTKKVPGDGKRLLRMAPLHHHFELLAYEKQKPETSVVLAFCLMQLLICLVVIASFKLFV